MFLHFVLQVSQTLSLPKLLPCKGARDPNRPTRSAALFWALFAQLFVQFEAQFEAEFELLNTQAEAISRNRRPQQTATTTVTAVPPIPRFYPGIAGFFLSDKNVFSLLVFILFFSYPHHPAGPPPPWGGINGHSPLRDVRAILPLGGEGHRVAWGVPVFLRYHFGLC